MSNWSTPSPPVTLTPLTLDVLRRGAPAGMTRRRLLRRTIGVGVLLVLAEGLLGTFRFLVSAIDIGFAGPVRIGTIDDLMAMPAVPGTNLHDGAPAYVFLAKAYVQLIDPELGMTDGESLDGSGTTTNVRALSQICPHLGCRPNFCTRNGLFECPCHQSRYDRLGTKILRFGPAPRGMTRFATSVEDGVLTIDTSVMKLGPLPLALGSFGLIPPTAPTGCI
ncbi:MAG TPA: Rieske 2Fe-2S domain-containing protein [Candidatus Limnocylindrales bacterium]